MIRVMIVDDHAMVRMGLERLLAATGDIEVVASVSSGPEAVAEYPKVRPDVVLMDVDLPGMSGIDSTRRIRESDPTARVVIVSTFEENREVNAAFDAGASGYFVKNVEPEVLISGIRAAMDGGVPLSPSVAARLVSFGWQRSAAPGGAPGLTPRERDVLHLIVDGCSNKQIATRLGLSEKTVKTHCGRLFRRIGVADRTQAAVWAERNLPNLSAPRR